MLAAKLEKVKTRLDADAPKMRQPGAALIAHFLDPDRLPVGKRWSRKHTYTQRRLCERFAAPVIGAVACQDIKASHMQRIVNAAPTAGEGDRVRRMLSALVTTGIDAGYLVNPGLAKVHWQAGDRPLSAPEVSVAGESGQWVDPAEIPSSEDVAKLGRRDADGNGKWTWHSLRHVFCTAALVTWKLDPTDAARMAGHSSYRVTLDMYVGSTAGVLDRARAATE